MILFNAIAFGYLAYSFYNLVESIILKDFRFNWRCAKCLSFWIALAVTQDVTFAALLSLTVYLLDSLVVTRL